VAPIQARVSDVVVTHTVSRVELRAGAAMKQAWRLYKRLFVRSLLLGGIVFGAVNLANAAVRTGRSGSWILLLTLILSVAGLALLQGGLIEIVRSLHVDGDDDPAVSELLRRASGKTLKLVRISILAGLGVGVGLVLFVVPGVVLFTRWAVAVPVGMLEEGSARDALRRSREIVRGNGWNVFKVLLGVSLLQIVVTIPFTLAAAGAGPFGWWVAATLASALTTPYAAHALTVVYYALVEPERPVVLESGQRWESIWAGQGPGARDESLHRAESLQNSIWNDD
jgi:hypothetical protein